MIKNIEVVFHNQGLRSYIEVDLCMDCPRQDGKGCCGNYSPVFYPSDFAYLLKNHPHIVDSIMAIKDVTILDASLTVNNSIDGDSYKCHFHSNETGCYLEQLQRESICRHFVCPGIGWEDEDSMKHWKAFFSQLADYEIELNNKIAAALKACGLSLRNTNQRQQFFTTLLNVFEKETRPHLDFLSSCKPVEHFTIRRPITLKEEWPL